MAFRCCFLLRRMDYSDAIKYLRENEIKKDDGTYYEFGEVSVQTLRTSVMFATII